MYVPIIKKTCRWLLGGLLLPLSSYVDLSACLGLPQLLVCYCKLPAALPCRSFKGTHSYNFVAGSSKPGSRRR